MLSVRNLLRTSCALALLCCPVLGHADTLKLLSSTANPSGGVDIYPYNFSVDGSNLQTSLVCLDYNREITTNEQWQVNIQHLDMGTSQTAVDYRADAYLYNTFGKNGYSASDVQYAIWSIFDSAVTSNSHFTSTSQTLVNMAMQNATNQNLINSGYFQNFLLYTPTSDQTGWTQGIPQEFIGAAAVAPTPEPSSLALLGTGLISAAFAFRNRFAPAKDVA